MPHLTIDMTWKSSIDVDIPEGMDIDELAEIINGGNLSDIPEEILDQMTSHGADLTDWEAW